MITSLADFSISLGLLAVLMAFFRFVPDWRLVALPLFTVLAFLAALGPGLFLTALNVKFRDFRYVIPFIVNSGSSSHPSALAATSSLKSGVFFIRLIRWSE